MKNLKEIAESPLVRVANFFLMLCITLLGAILLRAESNVKSEIEKNENKIQVLEEGICLGDICGYQYGNSWTHQRDA